MSKDDQEYQAILPVVHEYKELWVEWQNILQDIRQYRNQFKKRLDVLKKECLEKEKSILEFLEKHNHPGIQDHDLLLVRQEKKIRQPIKQRTQDVEEILTQYNVDRLLHQRVIDVLAKGNESTTPSLRIKVTSSSSGATRRRSTPR